MQQQADPAAPVVAVATPVQVTPNQCWGPAHIVPQATRKVAQVVTEQSRTRYKVSQATLRQGLQPVVVKDAAQTFHVQEPRYVPVTESVKVQDEFTRLRVVPAVFESQEQDVLVESARVGFRPCAAAGASLGKKASAPSQPSAQCAYNIAARYRKVRVQKLVQPETVQEEVVPAVYRNVTKMVLAEPATVVPVEIPATTVQVPVANVDTPPSATPEVVQAVTVELEVTDHQSLQPQLTWARVVCEHDLNAGLVHALQKSLQREGWLTGALDGRLGARTLQAVKDFQNSKGIGSQHLTYQALEWLGITPANR